MRTESDAWRLPGKGDEYLTCFPNGAPTAPGHGQLPELQHFSCPALLFAVQATLVQLHAKALFPSMPSIILNLTTTQVLALSTAQEAGLTTVDIAAFSTAQLAVMTTTQVRAFSTTSIRAFSTDQLANGLNTS